MMLAECVDVSVIKLLCQKEVAHNSMLVSALTMFQTPWAGDIWRIRSS